MNENQNSNEATMEILQKYNKLLNDAPETRSILAQDENLATFLRDTILQSDDQKILRTALEIILELISTTGDGNTVKNILHGDSGFKNVLMDLKEKFKNDVTIGFVCDSILDELFPGHRASINKPTAAPVTNANTRSRVPRFLGGASRQQLKTLIFQSDVFGNTEVKRSIEQALVKVKGVVSIYFENTSTNNKIWRCIVRVWTTITAEAIAESMLKTERLSSVQHVSKDEYGEEISTMYGNNDQPTTTTKDAMKETKPTRLADDPSVRQQLPAYLDENDDLIFGVMIGDHALAKFGDKESGKTGGGGGGWLSGVSSFFSKTLYW